MKNSLSSKPVFEIADLTLYRGDTVILKDISWRVMPGQHWVILGSNGSGKTSLLSALTGYLVPSEGGMCLFGHEYGRADWRILRKLVGLVSSSIRQRVEPGETALEVVVSGKYAMVNYWGNVKPADRKRALAILGQVEAAYLADRPWAYLSQGERQRVLIGRALMGKLRLLILDEPCAGLDPVAREQFLRFLTRFSKEKKAPTLIFVTHHVEEIMPFFSHVLILKDGWVVAADAKRKAMTSKNLAHAFSAPMRLSSKKGRYRLQIRSKKKVVV